VLKLKSESPKLVQNINLPLFLQGYKPDVRIRTEVEEERLRRRYKEEGLAGWILEEEEQRKEHAKLIR